MSNKHQIEDSLFRHEAIAQSHKTLDPVDLETITEEANTLKILILLVLIVTIISAMFSEHLIAAYYLLMQ